MPPRALARLSNKYRNNDVEELVGGLRSLLEAAARAKPTALDKSGLFNYAMNLKFPEVYAAALATAYESRKLELISKTAPRFSMLGCLTLEKFDWRVDISISSSTLKKHFDTVIIMNFVFSNGERRTLQASVKKFHMLRLCVASMLQEMQALEKKNSEKRWA